MNNPLNFQKDRLSQTAAKNRQSYPVENNCKDANGIGKFRVRQEVPYLKPDSQRWLIKGYFLSALDT